MQEAFMLAVVNSISKTIFHLPAEIEEFSNLEKIDNSTVKIVFSGQKILEIMEKFSNEGPTISPFMQTQEWYDSEDEFEINVSNWELYKQ